MSAERVRQRDEAINALRYWGTPLAALLREVQLPAVTTVVSAIAQLERQRAFVVDAAVHYCTTDGRAYAELFARVIGRVASNALTIGEVLAVRDLDPAAVRAEYIGLADALDRAYAEALDILMRVPIEWTPVRFQKGERLSATLHLGRLIRAARKRVEIFDRYLDRSLIDFLDDLPRTVRIRLVTTPGLGKSYGAEPLTSLAAIAATQYPDFHLISVDPATLHQRCIRIDDQIFRSDQSFRDLALQDGPLLSAAVADAAADRELDGIIASGQVIV
jgi:hypothetical protein